MLQLRLRRMMQIRIRAIDWPVAARDVMPFLAAPEQAGLKLWSERFFAGKVAKLVLGL